MLKNYRLGIDMGSTSIGWCMLELDENNNPCGIINMGVRISPDGRDDKTKESLSVTRREKRGARRNRDRYLLRITALFEKFIEIGFLPGNEKERKQLSLLNPYELRTKALDEKITKGELARALLHLAKRRGFLSNRKIKDESKESTDFKKAIENADEQIKKSGARTLGEFLHNRNKNVSESAHHQKTSIRFRYEKHYSDEERVFPSRAIVIDEFNKIWEEQSQHYDELNDVLKDEIFNLIFYQRPLKPQIVGNCIFEQSEKRAHKAQPIFQEFRLLQTLNDLKVISVADGQRRELTDDEWNVTYDLLQSKKEVKFIDIRKKLFKKEHNDYTFNFEYTNRDKMLGNEINALFNEKKNAELKEEWNRFDYEGQKGIIELLITNSEEDDVVIQEFVRLGINEENAHKFLYLNLPDGYGDISVKALEKIVPYMREKQMYSDACKSADYHHSEFYDGTIYDEGNLPYYGELLTKEAILLQRDSHDKEADTYGKINNPTVHIALNQLRKIVNALCKKYGPPKQIVVELARDLKLSKEHKDKLNKEMRKRSQDNERIAKDLEDLNVTNNRENRMKYRLWKELAKEPIERCCVYSGKQISIGALFSAAFEIEHILPKSRTFDDSVSNKTISHYTANRYKGERSPFEAFGKSQDGYNWEAIVARANKLPKNKAKRFLMSAMKDYLDENEVIARMLNDTRYMSKVAKKYLSYVSGKNNVWVVTGQQTAMIRGKWGLNKTLSSKTVEQDSEEQEIKNEDAVKQRDDHRHHAIDAFVIAMTSRSFIQRYASTIKNSRERFIEELDLPWDGFNHREFANRVKSINVSFKPDHANVAKLRKRNQTAGSLVEDTAYSLLHIDSDNDRYAFYCTRKEIGELTVKNIERIKSPEIKRWILSLNGDNKDKKVLQDKLKPWAKERNIKKIKMIERNNIDTMIPVKNKQGIIYKYYASGENLFCDIYQKDPSDPDGKWEVEIVNSYNAHQPDFVPRWKREYPMAKRIMRLFKNDIVAIDNGEGGRELRRVKKMTNSFVYLRHIHIAKKETGKDDVGECFSVNVLKRKRARKAGIDIIGRTFDPIVNEKNEHN